MSKIQNYASTRQIVEEILDGDTDMARARSLTSRLGQLRLGDTTTRGDKAWSYKPQLVEGKHWIKVGNAVFFTAAGRRRAIELLTRPAGEKA